MTWLRDETWRQPSSLAAWRTLAPAVVVTHRLAQPERPDCYWI